MKQKEQFCDNIVFRMQSAAAKNDGFVVERYECSLQMVPEFSLVQFKIFAKKGNSNGSVENF